MKKLLAFVLSLSVCFTALCACNKGSTDENTESKGYDFTQDDYSDFDYGYALNEDGTFKDIKALDYVTLPDLATITVPKTTTDISDEAVKAEIDTALSQYAYDEQITDREIADGDTVNISYVGKIDGVAFEGGSTSDEGTDVTIGQTQYIGDFIQKLVGHKPGDEFQITETFPENYETEGENSVNGKEATFDIKINYIVGKTDLLPELTDSFVTEHFASQYGWNTVDGMTKGVRKMLRDNAISNYVQTEIMGRSTITEVPEELYIYQTKCMLAYYSSYATQSGMDFQTYMGASIEETVESNEENNRVQAKYALVKQAVYEANPDLKVTDDDVKNFFLEYYKTEDYSEREEAYGKGYIHFVVLSAKVTDFLNAKVKYEDSALNLSK